MQKVVRTLQAEEDLLEIWLYIAADNPVAADRVLKNIDKAAINLSVYPGLGTACPYLRAETRYYIVGSYLIFYREVTDGIEVVRVVHGARHLPSLLQEL